jgi:site-specific DNA-methyltransferase (adenine-specific)
MGKTWDSSGIAYSVELWQECLRVLKPGGHLLAFGGTRTWHRLAVAIEDAGFEIRDSIAWLYGSGFPKSHNISKAIDKAAGAEREIRLEPRQGGGVQKGEFFQGGFTQIPGFKRVSDAVTNDAKKWDGWGTALKPAHEPIVVARKPLTGTVAQNVLEHGVGGLNIDATRIQGEVPSVPQWSRSTSNAPYNAEGRNGEMSQPSDLGRWPANIILDEYTAELLDEQSGNLKSGAMKSGTKAQDLQTNSMGRWNDRTLTSQFQASEGGASRFFYVAKASKRDRNEGLDELPLIDRGSPAQGMQNMDGGRDRFRQNFHPTVKPTALMQYLIRLVTPANGVVLDPFAGSGSTGKAAILENKHFIGIEVTPEYLPIIEGRLTHAYETLDSKQDE